MKVQSRYITLVLASLLPLCAGGCATLTSPGRSLLSHLIGDKKPAAEDHNLLVNGESVVVELHRGAGVLDRLRVPFKPGMVVQDVLEESRVIDRFSRMTIKLKRRTAGQQSYLPLTAVYDYDKRTVRPESNYSIRPGDFLIITEDRTTATEEIFRQLLGPLA